MNDGTPRTKPLVIINEKTYESYEDYENHPTSNRNVAESSKNYIYESESIREENTQTNTAVNLTTNHK
jgi:hypothetical protein